MLEHKPPRGYPWDLSDPEWIDNCEVSRRVSLEINTVYTLARAGSFPKQTKMHPCVARWRASEVEQWLKDHPLELRSTRQSRRAAAAWTTQPAAPHEPSPNPTTARQAIVDSLPRRFLKVSEVRARVALGTSTIYARIAAGTFPKPIRLSRYRVAWVESEIDAWMDRIIEEQRKAQP